MEEIIEEYEKEYQDIITIEVSLTNGNDQLCQSTRMKVPAARITDKGTEYILNQVKSYLQDIPKERQEIKDNLIKYLNRD